MKSARHTGESDFRRHFLSVRNASSQVLLLPVLPWPFVLTVFCGPGCSSPSDSRPGWEPSCSVEQEATVGSTEYVLMDTRM